MPWPGQEKTPSAMDWTEDDKYRGTTSFYPALTRGPQGVWHRQTPRAITGAPDIPYCPVMPGVQAAALGGSFTGGALPLHQTGALCPAETPVTSSLHHSGGCSVGWILHLFLGFVNGFSRRGRNAGFRVHQARDDIQRSLEIHGWKAIDFHFCFIGRSFLPYSPLPPAKLLCPLQNGLGQVAAPLSGGPAPLCGPGGPGLPPGCMSRPPRSSLWTE